MFGQFCLKFSGLFANFALNLHFLSFLTAVDMSNQVLLFFELIFALIALETDRLCALVDGIISVLDLIVLGQIRL